MYSARIRQETPCAVRYFDRPVRLDGRADLAVRPYGFQSRGGRRYLICSSASCCMRKRVTATISTLRCWGITASGSSRYCPKGKRLVVKPSNCMNATLRRQVQREQRLPDGRTLFSVVEQRDGSPFAEGQTPMYAALLHAYELVGTGVRCGSPRMLPACDFQYRRRSVGQRREGLSELAARIRRTGTDDGNALLMNIHISSDLTKTLWSSPLRKKNCRTAVRPFAVPDVGVMPPLYNENITALRGLCARYVQGVSYNASMTDLIGMMNIVSVSVTLMD